MQIEGFTDSVGADAYNQDLSERRAEAVKAALTMRGIDPSRISTEGYGKAFPVASNSDSGGRQLNRRVEVVIGNGNTPDRPAELELSGASHGIHARIPRPEESRPSFQLTNRIVFQETDHGNDIRSVR